MVSFALVFWDVMQLFLWMNIASQVLVPLPLVEKISKMCAMTCGVYLSGTQALLLDVAPPKIWGLITGFVMAGAEGQTGEISSTSEKSLGMKAVLIGATGAIGECLLGELLISKVCC